ncbi:MAG: hypothetical protein KJP18_15010 [Gemmatimonadetes bacterium]|nr:hypothetical protein [Gemmatimonadota bacterium]
MQQRIHFLVAGEDKARYEAQAASEGLSLGAWLREAAEARYRGSLAKQRFRTPEDLTRFFAACDQRETAPEPDWETQRRLIEGSRLDGLEAP